MNKRLPVILNVIMCVLLLVCLVKINTMQNQLDILKRDTTGRLQNIENEMYNLTYDIRRELEAESSLLVNSSWEFGKADFEAHTVVLHCEAVPKEYIPDETKAELVINAAAYPMSLKNGVFMADVSVPLVDESHVESVSFTEGENIRTEQLDWYMNPRYDFLAQVYADFSGSVSGGVEDSSKNPGTSVFKVTYDGEVNVNVELKGNDKEMAAIRVLETIDGKEVTDRDLPLDKGVVITDNGVEFDQAADDAIQGFSGYYYFRLKHSVEVPLGSVYAMYVEVEDANGICYKQNVYYERISKEGQPVEDDKYNHYDYDSEIYDKTGKLLFGMDEKSY